MTPCILWDGPINDGGYGRVYVNGVRRLAHRVAFERATGISPIGYCVCHRCDVPACVNPDHLFLGTQQDNLQDMRDKGRQRNPPPKRGEDHYEQKLSEDDVRDMRVRYTGVRGEIKAMAAEYGVTNGMVRHVIHRRKWKHVP